jgi:hypothetical protein
VIDAALKCVGAATGAADGLPVVVGARLADVGVAAGVVDA